jgi:hypothetical protein
VPANTFDNVKGEFPIGFTIWNLNEKVKIEQIICDVYDRNGEYIGEKNFYGDLPDIINKWIVSYRNSGTNIGYLTTRGNDFQNNNFIQIINDKSLVKSDRGVFINIINIVPICIYFAVRHCIEATWLNDRDQFLYPNDGWQTDTEFQNDCLAFTLFHGQNKISSKDGTNHWIPFTEQEVNAREKFESNFMSKFINGKLKNDRSGDLYGNQTQRTTALEFSTEATAVFDAGRELWKYYHQQPKCNVNASLYDIKEFFQGRNEKGKMNNKSSDETYMNLIGNLREKLRQLADKIEPKVYEYEFLKQ